MNSSKSQPANVKVFCRFRPFSKQELQTGNDIQVQNIISDRHLLVKDPNKDDDLTFVYDKIFDMQANQEQIYNEVAAPILSNILDGFNGTIIAYGQTSSGKTYTIQGNSSDATNKGIIPRIIQNLFIAIENSPPSIEFKLKVSILELYMQKLYDLIDCQKTDLKIRESKSEGNYVEGKTQAYISDKFQLMRLVNIAHKNRVTTMTHMNANSSRSHLIFHLTLNQLNSDTEQAKVSNLFIVDLAGSEKVSRTGAQGKTLQQAKKINLSLTCLAKVIKSLSQKIPHIPYRDSKLTRIIQDSLGGNSKTTLILTCSPHDSNINETISTLRFGQTAQKIKNKPKINREPTIKQLQNMIIKLENKIKAKDHHILMLETHMKSKIGLGLPKLDDIKRYSSYLKEQKMYSTMQMSANWPMASLRQSYTQSSFQNLNSSIMPQAYTKQFQNYLREYESSYEHETMKKTTSKTLQTNLKIPQLDDKSDIQNMYQMIDLHQSEQVNSNTNGNGNKNGNNIHAYHLHYSNQHDNYQERIHNLEVQIAQCRSLLANQCYKYGLLKKENVELELSLKSVAEECLMYKLKIVDIQDKFGVQPKSFTLISESRKQSNNSEDSSPCESHEQLKLHQQNLTPVLTCNHHKQCPQHNHLLQQSLLLQKFYQAIKVQKKRLQIKLTQKDEKVRQLKSMLMQIEQQMELMALENDELGFNFNPNTKIANPIKKSWEEKVREE